MYAIVLTCDMTLCTPGCGTTVHQGIAAAHFESLRAVAAAAHSLEDRTASCSTAFDLKSIVQLHPDLWSADTSSQLMGVLCKLVTALGEHITEVRLGPRAGSRYRMIQSMVAPRWHGA